MTTTNITDEGRRRHDQLVEKLGDKTISAKEIDELDRLRSDGYGDDWLARKQPVNRPPHAKKENISKPLNSRARSGFGRAVLHGGFDLKSNPSISIPGSVLVESKAITLPVPATWAPMAPQLAPLGRDSRFLYPNLDIRDAGEATSVETFRQTGARTVTGSVMRDLDATTIKADLALTLTAVNEPLVQAAVTVSNLPNQVLQSVDGVIDFLNSEGLYQVQLSVDAHVYGAIEDANPPFGLTGADLITQVRNGISEMRALGASPDLLVLNPSDSAELDLIQDDGGFVFPFRTGEASPLWGLTVVEHSIPTDAAPLLIDSSLIGSLYLGSIQFQADPFTGFVRNTTTLRIETNCLMVVRQPTGAYRIAAA